MATLIEYIGSNDYNYLGSRKSHSCLILWYALKTMGHSGFIEAETCIQNAQYLHHQLKLRQYPCMLNAFSKTVVFAKPSKLAVLGDWAYIIVMQNTTK